MAQGAQLKGVYIGIQDYNLKHGFVIDSYMGNQPMIHYRHRWQGSVNDVT